MAESKADTIETRCRHCGDTHPASFSHCPKTGQSLSSGEALIGRVIANRYRVLSLIEEGGMGAVYVAEHLQIGRQVALKRLHPELNTDERAVARFEREARTAAATGHHHVVEVLDLGVAEDGAPYLVMEYVKGRSLARLLEAETKLMPTRAARIAGQVLSALVALHRHGIVHRDLKPDNIILTRRRSDRDFVKLVDFGISKVQPAKGELPMHLTRTGVMLGTPYYMSPEQARGAKSLDHRVDLFAVGVILYECITGQLPFQGDNYHQLLQSILSGDHATAVELEPSLDPQLSEAIEHAIALTPGERFQSAAEMLTALAPFGAESDLTESEFPAPMREASAAPSKGPMLDTMDEPAPVATTPDRKTPPPPRRRAAPSSTSRPLKRPSTPPPESSMSVNPPRGLVPTPARLDGPPRRFSAASSDWKAQSPASRAHRPSGLTRISSAGSSVRRPRSTLGGARRPSSASMNQTRSGAARRAPSGSHRPVTEGDPVRADAPMRTKGSLVLTTMDVLRADGPDCLRKVARRLGPRTAGRISSVILPMSWAPLEDFVDLLRAGCREHSGGRQGLPNAVGRLLADTEFANTHRLFMAEATPVAAVERIPDVFRSLHSHGETVVAPSSGGFAVKCTGLKPDALAHALLLAAFYQRMLELTGASDVRASVVSSVERGDSATVTMLRWR